MLTSLIDGDIVIFRCAASAENEEYEVAEARVMSLMTRITSDTGTLESFHTYLSGSENFRLSLFPAYKANRPEKRPKHLQALREYLITEWGAKVSCGYEADDSISLKATQLKDNYIVCSIDKDLKQIPGTHYNFVTLELQEISEVGALRNFYKGMLIGDTADNIKGVNRIGKVKAGILLDHLETEEEMFDAVRRCYDNDERMLLNGSLMWLLREEEAVWPYGQKLAKRAL